MLTKLSNRCWPQRLYLHPPNSKLWKKLHRGCGQMDALQPAPAEYCKTEVIRSTSSRRLHLLPVSLIRVGTDQVMQVSVVRNLGIYMDADVSMRSHVSKTAAACFAMRQLRSIRRSVPRSVLYSHWFRLVLQRLDYGNATLAGITSHLTKRMQSVLNSAARLVFSVGLSRYDRITPLLTQLHLLKVPECIKFKLAILVDRCLHQTAPPYLAEELHQSSADEALQPLRSASTSSLVVRRTRLSAIGDRAFPVVAARLWNSLPLNVASA